MSFSVKSQEEYIDLLRSSYEKLTTDFLRLSEEKNHAENQVKAEASRAEERLLEQKTHYQSIIEDQKRRIGEFEDQVKNLQGEENSLHRKEIRKYVQNLNEKEIQISNLKRQINSMKTKITSLEQEINNLTNSKENYEIFVLKSIQQIKTKIKESYTFLQDIQNEKMILSSKYRQLIEKTVLLENQYLQIKGQKETLKQSYNNLHHFFKSSKDQCLKLKFQVEKLKEASRNGRSSPSVQSTVEEQFIIIKDVDEILELKNTINSCESYLIQTNQFSEMNKLLISQNNQLKIKIAEIESQMNDIKIKYVQDFEDKLLKEREPSLYEYLLKKKEQIEEYEKKIQKIESYIEEKDEQINTVIGSMLHKHKECFCGKGQEVQKLTCDLNDAKKKLDFFTENNQKIKKENQSLEEKIFKYVEEVKDLLENKGPKKKRSAGKVRCRFCYLPFEKTQNMQTCQDCKKKFHDGNCILHHACDSYTFEEGASNYSGLGQ